MAQMEETVLNFKVSDAGGESYIDIAQCMSIVNRKLYRQQGLWQVLGVNLYADALNSDQAPPQRVGVPYTVAISGAPRTWVTRNALVKAYHAWIDQQNLALDASSQSIKPKWQDFKVWLNDNHRTNTALTPVSGHMFGGDDAYEVGEWVRSKIVWEDVTGAGLVEQHEPELTILGDDNMPQTVALITQYGMSRAIPQSPDPLIPGDVSLNIYAQSAAALSEQIEEITTNMFYDNNDAPYDPETYPGSKNGALDNGFEPLLFGYVATATGATKGRKTSMNGFAAPNGLLEIQYSLDLQAPAPSAGVPIPTPRTVPELWLQIVIGRRSDY